VANPLLSLISPETTNTPTGDSQKPADVDHATTNGDSHAAEDGADQGGECTTTLCWKCHRLQLRIGIDVPANNNQKLSSN
jgi:hypothetical protein